MNLPSWLLCPVNSNSRRVTESGVDEDADHLQFLCSAALKSGDIRDWIDCFKTLVFSAEVMGHQRVNRLFKALGFSAEVMGHLRVKRFKQLIIIICVIFSRWLRMSRNILSISCNECFIESCIQAREINERSVFATRFTTLTMIVNLLRSSLDLERARDREEWRKKKI